MKKVYHAIKYFVLMLLSSCYATTKSKPDNTMDNQKSESTSFYSFKMKTIEGKEFDFATLKGKKVLIVNTASECGYTPQYKDLQKLHEAYGNKLVILGFPSNEFGGQEPGSNQEIASFCEKNYGVTFQMFAKIVVKGTDKHPLYQWLTDKSQNGWNSQEPSWNFNKYLIDEKGQLLKYFSSGVKPMSEEITSLL